MWLKLRWRKWGWRIRKEIGHAELSRPCSISHCTWDKLPQISDLKQYKCTILQFYRSEVWGGSHWTKTKVPPGLHSFPEALGENPFSWLLLLGRLPAFLGSWLPSTFTTSNSQWGPFYCFEFLLPLLSSHLPEPLFCFWELTCLEWVYPDYTE